MHLKAKDIELGETTILEAVFVVLATQKALLARRFEGHELRKVVLGRPEDEAAVVGASPLQPACETRREF